MAVPAFEKSSSREGGQDMSKSGFCEDLEDDMHLLGGACNKFGESWLSEHWWWEISVDDTTEPQGHISRSQMCKLYVTEQLNLDVIGWMRALIASISEEIQKVENIQWVRQQLCREKLS